MAASSGGWWQICSTCCAAWRISVSLRLAACRGTALPPPVTKPGGLLRGCCFVRPNPRQARGSRRQSRGKRSLWRALRTPRNVHGVNTCCSSVGIPPSPRALLGLPAAPSPISSSAQSPSPTVLELVCTGSPAALVLGDLPPLGGLSGVKTTAVGSPTR